MRMGRRQRMGEEGKMKDGEEKPDTDETNINYIIIRHTPTEGESGCRWGENVKYVPIHTRTCFANTHGIFV